MTWDRIVPCQGNHYPSDLCLLYVAYTQAIYQMLSQTIIMCWLLTIWGWTCRRKRWHEVSTSLHTLKQVNVKRISWALFQSYSNQSITGISRRISENRVSLWRKGRTCVPFNICKDKPLQHNCCCRCMISSSIYSILPDRTMKSCVLHIKHIQSELHLKPNLRHNSFSKDMIIF